MSAAVLQEVRAWPVPVSDTSPALSPQHRSAGPLRVGAHVQGVLPLLASRPRPVLAVVRARAPELADDGPRATATADLPDAAALVRTVAAAVLEVLTGCRPASQLMRWTSPQVQAALSARACAAARARRPGSPLQRTGVLRVSTCDPRDGVVEAAVVVTVDARARAMAVRLEGWDGRWRVTVLELG